MKNGSMWVCAITIALSIFIPTSGIAQTSASTTCPQLLLPLAVGSKNMQTPQEVSALQLFLSQMSTGTPLAVTGYFGELTTQALRKFQISRGLSPSGTVTASTSAAIEMSCLSTISVSFSSPNLLSLSATPSISGTAQDLGTPLMLSITSKQDGTLSYKNANVPLVNDSWTITAPALPVGLYLMTLSTQGIPLATSTLAVGIASIPTVLSEQASLPISDVADGRLFRFAVHAGEENDTAIGQFTFAIATGSADVSGVNLYAYSDQAFSIPATTSAAGNLVNDSPLDPGSGELVVTPDTPILIPSGQTYFFELDATVIPSDTSYWVTTSLLGDSFIVQADTFAGLQSNGANFIWSPYVFGETATTAADWINGSILSGLGDKLTETRTSTPVPPTPASVPIVTNVAAVSTSSSTNNSGTATSSATSTSSTSTATSTATTTPLGQFTAKPTSGPIPLSVTFTGSVNASKSCSESIFSLYLGDGASTSIPVAAKKCNIVTFSISHRYLKAGVFTVSLYSATTSSSTRLVQSQVITAGTTTKTAFLNSPYLAAVISATSFDLFTLLQWAVSFLRI